MRFEWFCGELASANRPAKSEKVESRDRKVFIEFVPPKHSQNAHQRRLPADYRELRELRWLSARTNDHQLAIEDRIPKTLVADSAGVWWSALLGIRRGSDVHLVR